MFLFVNSDWLHSYTPTTFGSARLAAERQWSIVSANISPVYSVKSHWDIYSASSEESGRAASGANWRVARNLLVAPTESEAEDRVFHADASSRYYFTYMHGVFSALDYLILVKPDPDMADTDCTADASPDSKTTPRPKAPFNMTLPPAKALP